MADRWLTLEVEPEPSAEFRPGPAREATDRRPIAIRVEVPPQRRHLMWSAVIAILLVGGALTGVVGAWMTGSSDLGWNDVVRDSAVVRDDLAVRSQLAATTLTEQFAELERTAASLGDLSTALDTASRVAADLEEAARAGPPSNEAELEQLTGAIFRLADALDDAFPELAEVGLAGAIGPGEALRATSEALTIPSTAPAPAPVTGFGPFVLQNPLPGRAVTNPFGTTRGESVHNGIDFGAPAGTEILAAADGVVERAGWLDEAAGNGVILRHGGGWETRYFHMVSADVPVAVGDRVSAGEVIGRVGSTGISTGPHLHFEIVFGPVRMDPLGPSFAFDTVIETVGDAPEVPTTEDRELVADDNVTPALDEPTSEIAALSDVLMRIAAVQTELKEIAADASDEAGSLQARAFEQQSRSNTAALILYCGALAVVIGLLLMWATRPQWPPTR